MKQRYLPQIGLLLLYCGISIGQAYAYSPPIGIPNPDWGAIGDPIDASAPAAPSAWPGNDAAGYYYVDSDHPSATNSVQSGDLTDNHGNRYGYPDVPRASVPTSPFVAGSYVEVHGTFSSTTSVRFEFNCTEANPCWFRGTPNDMPNIRGYWGYQNTQYLFQEYFDFDGHGVATGPSTGVSSYSDGNSHHIILRNNLLHDRTYTGHSSGIGITAGMRDTAPNAVTSDIIIYNNDINTLGQWDDYSGDYDFHGVNPSLWNRQNNEVIRDVWILNNKFSYLSGDSVQINAGGGSHGQESARWRDHIHHVYIGANEAHHNRQSGFAVKQATDVIISENYIHDMPKPTGTIGSGIMWLYGPTNVWVLNNRIHDTRIGIRQSTTNNEGLETSTYVIGNVIYNCSPGPNAGNSELQKTNRFKSGQGVSYVHSVGNRYTAYNTIDRCSGGINIAADSPSYTENNIITNIDNDDAFISVLPVNSPNANTIMTANLCYDPDVQNYYWDGRLSTSLSSFQSRSGQAASFVTADPLYRNAAIHDYTLASTSQARGSGIDVDVFNTFNLLYGIDIREDILGRFRSGGVGGDMGAYVVNTSAKAPPSPPQASGSKI